MNELFPYSTAIATTLILVVGFGFHWLGQLISVVDWPLATRLGLQEAQLLPEYKVYEHAIAVADSVVGAVYGLAALGLYLDAVWGYKLAFVPGSTLIHHAICAWVWEGNRRAAGHGLWPDALRSGWCTLNAATGAFVIVAWTSLDT